MKDIKDLLPNTTKVKKDPKDINLKDLIVVDYTDGSWPEDEEGQLAYDYSKRVEENLDERASWIDGYIDKYTKMSYSPKDEVLTLTWRNYEKWPKKVSLDKASWEMLSKSQNLPRTFNQLWMSGKIKTMKEETSLDEEEIEEAIDWFKLVYGETKLGIAKRIKATPSKTLETLAKPNPDAAGAQKFQRDFAIKELEYRKKIGDHENGNPKYKANYASYGNLGIKGNLEEAYDTQVSKYELNLQLKRVNDRIKFLRAAHYGSALPKDIALELKRLQDSKDSIIAMLKEEDLMQEADESYLVEALNMLQRMRRRAIMRKNKAKILMGRRRAQRKRASTSVLQQRAIRAARSALARKLLRKDKGEASYSEKVRVEKALAARQGAIKTLARRMLSKIRQKERLRFQPKPETQTPKDTK